MMQYNQYNTYKHISIVEKRFMQKCFCVFLLLCLITVASKPVNAVTGNDVFIVDVTPTSFSVIWTINETSNQGDVLVYTDPLGTATVTGITIQNHTQLFDGSVNSQALTNGVMRAVVSGLQPETAYFVRTRTYRATAEDYPPAGQPLLAVKTQTISRAVSNESYVLSVSPGDASPDASSAMLLLSVEGSPYPVSTMVGEGTTQPQFGIINTSNLYDSGGSNLEITAVGGEAMTVTVLGGVMGRLTVPSTAPANDKQGATKGIAPYFITLQTEMDSDGDTIPDWYETQYNLEADDNSDNDGLTDLQEYQLGTNPTLDDTDGDGRPDDLEVTEGTSPIYADSDLDGIPDNTEASSSTDPMDPDSDDDGFTDGDELAAGTNPTLNTDFPIIDTDGDGVNDTSDNCPLIQNNDQANLDGDAFGDVCDDDIDGDGFLNGNDNSPYNYSLNQNDWDSDGVGDVGDNCPNDYNPAQTDTDGDLQGNACDSDDDADGVPDYQTISASTTPHIFTSVPTFKGTTFDLHANPDAAIGIYKHYPDVPDEVLVGILDLSTFEWMPQMLTGEDLTKQGWLSVHPNLYLCGCVFARDDDTITLVTDTGEIEIYFPSSITYSYGGSTIDFVATDGSYYTSYWSGTTTLAGLKESAVDKVPDDNCRTVPNNTAPDIQNDSDGDGIGDACDITPEDMDGDAVLDVDDNCPINNPDQADFDGDKIGDACDDDSDNDGLPDNEENLLGTDIFNIDSDGDGIIDGDEDHDFDGVSNQLEIIQGTDLLVAEGRYTAGFNQFHYPYDVPDGLTAFALLADLGGNTRVINIQRRNPATGLVETAQYNGATPEGVDFPIVEGEGYILNSVTAFTKSFTSPVQCNGSDLVAGLNLMGFSCVPAHYSAYDLLQDLGGVSMVSSIQRFNQQTGRFETATFQGTDPVGVDFPLSNTEAYLVHAKQAVTLTTPTVIPSLSNFSITEDQIINTTTFDVSGTVNDPDLQVTVNGVVATITGNTFTATITLTEGLHPITIVSLSTNNLSFSQTINIIVGIPPVITIASHTDGETVNQINTIVFGTTDRPVSEVRVNGNLATLTDSTTFHYGLHPQRFDLVDGENTITVEATSDVGVPATPVTFTVNRQTLVVNTVNPGISTHTISGGIPEATLSTVASIFPWLDTIWGYDNVFTTPFDAAVRDANNIIMNLDRVSADFEFDLNDCASATYDTEMQIQFRTAGGSTVAIFYVPVQVNIPASTVPPTIEPFITAGDSLNDRFTYLNPAILSGKVSPSTGEVLVNGVTARVYDNVQTKRYYAMGIPLAKHGQNTITVEVRGEGYALGDTTVVTTQQFDITYERKDITVLPGTGTSVSYDMRMPPEYENTSNFCSGSGCIRVFDNLGNFSDTLKVSTVNTPSPGFTCQYRDRNFNWQFGCIDFRQTFYVSHKTSPAVEGIYDDRVEAGHSDPANIPVHATVLNSTPTPPVVITFVSPINDSTTSAATTDVVITTDIPDASTIPLMLQHNKVVLSITPTIVGNQVTWSNVPLDVGINDFEIFADGYLPRLEPWVRVTYTPP